MKLGFVCLAAAMDVFSYTFGVGSGSLDRSLPLTALQKARQSHRPEIHYSDQCLQYAATYCTDLLKQHGIQISIAQVGEPTQNRYAERLMRSIKEEEVDLSDYHDAYQQIGRFLEDVYIRKRVHSSLSYLTPTESEAQWLSALHVDSRVPR